MKQLYLVRQSLSIIPAISLFLNLTMMDVAVAQEKVLQTLTVTGQGIERIPTSLTQVQLGVEVQGKTATEVQQQVARQTTAVVEFLRTRPIERLQTAGIGLQPNYDYSNNQRRLLGFIGTNTVSFRIKTEQIGNLLDEAVQRGATRIDGISFTATDDAIATAQKEALRKATQDAQQQSDAVLRALNLTAKEVVSIQINNANPPQPRFYNEQALAKASADVSSPVIGGEQAVQASVTLQIRY